MKQLKKTALFIIASMFMIFGISFVPAATYAANSTNICDQDVPQEVKDANGCKGTSSADFNKVVVNIINGVIGALSIVVVIMIIVGGVGYLTSGGDAGKVEKAKKTILYAVIGAVICVLAFAITNFVATGLKKAG